MYLKRTQYIHAMLTNWKGAAVLAMAQVSFSCDMLAVEIEPATP